MSGAILSQTFFQLPIPPILFLIPPAHALQWLFRGIFLVYYFLTAVPLALILVPISVFCHSCSPGPTSVKPLRRYTLLPIHPDNLPPNVPITAAIVRGIAVYWLGTFIWAITSLGNAPEATEDGARWTSKLTCKLINMFPGHTRLVVFEQYIRPAPEWTKIGVLSDCQVEHEEMLLLTLQNHSQTPATTAAKQYRRRDGGSGGKAILYLAGGGYVTGTPLGQPAMFSLVRSLPPVEESGYTLFAPYVRKSLSRDRAFPVPLIDALAAYVHIRQLGYAAEDVTLIGDSAGGGLCWSLLAYLAVFGEAKVKHPIDGMTLGVPGRSVLISPWLSLPPTPTTLYPDLVDQPQLLNAARCYLGRYPILKHRPDAFGSDLPLYLEAISQAFRRATSGIPLMRHKQTKDIEEVEKDVLQPQDDIKPSQKYAKLGAWLREEVFEELSSHHPLLSPSTDLSSAFVQGVLQILTREKSRMLVYAGTAEWFYQPAMDLAESARAVGVDVTVGEEEGGFHVEGCLAPREWTGASDRLVSTMEKWMEDGESSRN